jgi:hypothetical protein
MEVPLVTRFELDIGPVRRTEDKFEELETVADPPLDNLMARRKLLVSLEAPNEIDPPDILVKSILSVPGL